tara:strand:+ start:919 stop:1107 length:189 start_codon:yes stop_codon:yes gene_type:complete
MNVEKKMRSDEISSLKAYCDFSVACFGCFFYFIIFYHWIKVDLIKKRVTDFLLKKVNVLGFI